MIGTVQETGSPDSSRTALQRSGYGRGTAQIAIAIAFTALVILLWRSTLSLGNPDPLAPNAGKSAAIFDIAVLVLREGLECILVLATIIAGLSAVRTRTVRPARYGLRDICVV